MELLEIQSTIVQAFAAKNIAVTIAPAHVMKSQYMLTVDLPDDLQEKKYAGAYQLMREKLGDVFIRSEDHFGDADKLFILFVTKT